MSRRRSPTRALATGAVLAGLLLATGCTGGTGGGPSAPAATGAGTTSVVSGSTAAPAPGSPAPATSATSAPHALPRPRHVVVVIFENKSSDAVLGSPDAPYLNGLRASSALLTGSRAVAHPSQPNYLALFSGSTQGITDDRCPLSLGVRPNLASQLAAAGRSFVGYSEDLPAPDYGGCSAGRYAAKHAPWVHFSGLPAGTGQPYTAFPADPARLPSVAFVVPDLCHDMHDCSVSTGDSWARAHLDGYARWARANDSLLVVTFDENDSSPGNRIFTLVGGAGVRPGSYPEPVTHYRLLRTVEALEGLPGIGRAAAEAPVTGIWG